MTLDVAAQMAQDFETVNQSLDQGIKLISIMSGVILALIAWIWNSSYIKQTKTDDKVDKLTDQITRLATLMEMVIPETKENTNKINDIRENCATNNHKRKTA